MSSAPRAVLRFIARGSRRVVVTIVGVAVLTAGGIMMITPGPGLLFIVLGLGILGTEYAWARRAYEKTKEKAKQTGKAARRMVRRKKPGPPADAG